MKIKIKNPENKLRGENKQNQKNIKPFKVKKTQIRNPLKKKKTTTPEFKYLTSGDRERNKPKKKTFKALNVKTTQIRNPSIKENPITKFQIPVQTWECKHIQYQTRNTERDRQTGRRINPRKEKGTCEREKRQRRRLEFGIWNLEFGPGLCSLLGAF